MDVDVVRVVAPLVALIIPTMSWIYCLNLSVRFFPSLEGNGRTSKAGVSFMLKGKKRESCYDMVIVMVVVEG